MKKDKNSANIGSSANVVMSSITQVENEKEENTNIKLLEDIVASIPSKKVITDADRFAFLEDDGGY